MAVGTGKERVSKRENGLCFASLAKWFCLEWQCKPHKFASSKQQNVKQLDSKTMETQKIFNLVILDASWSMESIYTQARRAVCHSARQGIGGGDEVKG